MTRGLARRLGRSRPDAAGQRPAWERYSIYIRGKDTIRLIFRYFRTEHDSSAFLLPLFSPYPLCPPFSPYLSFLHVSSNYSRLSFLPFLCVTCSSCPVFLCVSVSIFLSLFISLFVTVSLSLYHTLSLYI